MAESKKTRKAETKGGLKIKLVRSVISTTRYQREVIRGLGLRRINHTVERVDTPEVRGMVAKVKHLVELVEVSPVETREWKRIET
ncbi:MAG: 50S ribosomal protein L30 [Vicinamibacteria bacterium]